MKGKLEDRISKKKNKKKSQLSEEIKQRRLFRLYSIAIIRIHKADALLVVMEMLFRMCSEMDSVFAFHSFLFH